MTIIIGTDEAGYGPNLGPLVIAATAWRVSDALPETDLHESLSEAVCRNAKDAQSRVAIADSKLLYKPGGSLALLETAVHAGLRVLNRDSNSWRGLFETLTTAAADCLPVVPWYADFAANVPMDATDATVQSSTNQLHEACTNAGIELLDLRATVIFPEQFNARVRQLGSKGSLLTEQTLQLVDDVFARCPNDNTQVYCDKHGGRNRYAAALQQTWPDSWVNIIHESRASSEYMLGISGHDIRFRFAVGGESQLASALASMIAKYLRELAMRAFNAYWQSHVHGLRPTAGYPVDAKRFKREIEAARRRLRIDDDILWRCK